MSLQVCFKCRKVTRHFTDPYQELPCDHEKYNYSNENQRKIPDDVKFVRPVDSEGNKIDFSEMQGDIPDKFNHSVWVIEGSDGFKRISNSREDLPNPYDVRKDGSILLKKSEDFR